MKDKYIALALDIIEHEKFKSDYETLFKAYILHLVGDDYSQPTREIGLRLSRAAQIFVVSDIPSNIEIGVRIIDMFMELSPPYLEDLLIVGAAMFSHLGNFPNVTLINNRWNKRKQISFSLDRDLTDEMHKHINTIEVLGIEATSFQVDLWSDLQDGKDLVTIAPTSTGKSYIIMQYIIQRMIEAANNIAYAVYIVPTRALIYEVSRKIQNILSEKKITDIDVATIAQRGKEYSRKTIFILTQERMLMLLHFQSLMQFSYIVIDEAQNIAEGSRGVLLHIALSNAINRGQVQLIFSTPSINYKNTFNSLLDGKDAPLCDTEHSPVSKNYIFVKCKGSDLILSSNLPEVEIRIPKNFLNKDYDQIVKRLGAKNNNIVYANTKSECEKIVKKLLLSATTENAELNAAADYVKKTVHEEYSLARAIKKGIAFHYGPLPRNIRIMIENYVEAGLIDYIVCTSTLAEGVNMPAQNLFIRDPKIFSKRGTPAKPMSGVRFRNIIGRAGRLMKHFSGNVFYVDYDNWEFKDNLKEQSEDQQLPTYFKILRDNTDNIIRIMRGEEISDGTDLNTLNATVNKILQDNKEGKLEQILAEHVDAKKIKKVVRAIDNLLGSIELSPAILNLNPIVGIVQQNKLYKYLYASEDFQQWQPMSPHDGRFETYLRNLLTLLIEYDFLKIDGFKDPRFLDSYKYKVCTTANSWVKGKALRDIIQDYITAVSRKPNPRKINIDYTVKEIVELIDNVIRFKLASAVKCFCDIYILTADQKGLNPDDIPEICSALEIGACDKVTIALISSGLSRQTAIEIFKLMHDIDPESSNIINQIKQHPQYLHLHKITQKEIESLQR